MSSYEDNTYQAAAIISPDGKVWAQTSKFPQVKAEERVAIMREFDEPETLTMIGLYLGGTKYVVIGVELGVVIRASKVVEPGDVTWAWKWPEGVTTKKTSVALVIGIYCNPGTFNSCNSIVERVGEDLIKRGYSARNDRTIPS